MGSRRVCVLNQRASVGKTVTAVNLAAALSIAGRRTLLVDLDPACSANHPLASDETPPMPLSAPPSPDRLDLLLGSGNVESLARLAIEGEPARTQLGEQLRIRTEGYDWVLVDCPSSLGWLTEIALLASDEVLVPIACEYFAMEGTTHLIQLVKKIMKRPNQQLEFSGILLTMHEDSLCLTLKVDKEIREFFGEIVFDTVIPRDGAVAESLARQQCLFESSPRSRVARAYAELCMEVMHGE
jgi:chromosome partitioning protein